MRSVPLLLVDRESTTFLGVRLGAKESRDLSRQRGLTIVLEPDPRKIEKEGLT